MDAFEKLYDGFVLMILGMGMVFLFLSFLIFVMRGIEFIAKIYGGDKEEIGEKVDKNLEIVATLSAIAYHLQKDNKN